MYCIRCRGIPWRTNSTDDAAAVERHAAFRIGAFSDPVYTTGDWPQIMKDTLPPSYLPRFTEAEKKDLLGLSNFENNLLISNSLKVLPISLLLTHIALNGYRPLWMD